MTAEILQMFAKQAEPVVSIPVAGDRPMFVRTNLLKVAIREMLIESVKVENRWLIVKGRDAKYRNTIRRMYKFCDMDAARAKRLMEKWKPKVVAPKLNAREKEIARLEKKLAKVARRPRLPWESRWWGDQGYSDYERERILAWYQEKPKRRKFHTLVEWQRERCNQDFVIDRPHDLRVDTQEWGAARYEGCGYLSDEARELRTTIRAIREIEA